MSRILVVEDTQDNYDLIVDALGDAHQLECAATGDVALELAKSFRPDLILLDMQLPGMDGWELAQLMKADPQLAGIPLIALTAHAMQGDRQRCLEVGCDDYMAKPIDVAALPAFLCRFLNCERIP